LQLLELLGLIELHHAKLTLPAVEGLLTDGVFLAHRYDRRSGLLGLTQYTDLLLGGVSLSFYILGPF
jgi:hypothetical protein